MAVCITKGDTGVGFRASLYKDDKPVDLDVAEIKFTFGKHEITPSVEDDRLLVVFDSEHTEKSGMYSGKFKLMYSDGRVETYPAYCEEKILIKIGEWIQMRNYLLQETVRLHHNKKRKAKKGSNLQKEATARSTLK